MNTIEQVMRGLEVFKRDLVVRLARGVTKDLRTDTPVDTGWAESSWIAGIGKDPKKVNAPRKRVDRLNAVGARRATQIASLAALDGYTLRQGVVIVINDTHYLEYLNKGTSDDAPAFFVQRAIKRSVLSVRTRR